MSADLVARGLAQQARTTAASVQRSSGFAALVAALRTNGAMPQAQARTVARYPADVPALAWGAASAITARAATNPLIALSDAKLKFIGGAAVYRVYSGWNPRGAYGGTAGRLTCYGAMGFVFNGSDFDIPINAGNFYAAAANIRILVNDRVVATSALPVFNNGSWYHLRVTFPSAATRRIRIEGAGGGHWRGVNCANLGHVTPSQRNYPLVCVMGDSFVEGTGTTGFDGEAVVMARALGLDIAPGGVGSTGLIAPGTGGRVNWVNPTRITDLTLAGVTGAGLTGSTRRASPI